MRKANYQKYDIWKGENDIPKKYFNNIIKMSY